MPFECDLKLQYSHKPSLIDLVFLAISGDMLVNHDVNLAVQFIEHNIDIVENRIRVVGIVKVGVALSCRWRCHSAARTAQRNRRRCRRV